MLTPGGGIIWRRCISFELTAAGLVKCLWNLDSLRQMDALQNMQLMVI